MTEIDYNEQFFENTADLFYSLSSDKQSEIISNWNREYEYNCLDFEELSERMAENPLRRVSVDEQLELILKEIDELFIRKEADYGFYLYYLDGVVKKP
jgi:hypothetical protein|tara:strand:+ start:133 stop:426 length:294 start_codon:yes stop_codon:yes gene_type:complete